MTKEDMDGLWELLSIFRKNDPHLRDKKLKSAWLLLLEPWTPAEVKQAVTEQFRDAGYWPDPTEIAVRCPRRGPTVSGTKKSRMELSTFSPEEIARMNAQMDEMLAVGAMVAKDYIGAGIPHPDEARKLGWSAMRWVDKCMEAGL